MNNFVYASDKNYNKQLYYSINSLLENIDTKVTIYVIHKEPESFSNFKYRLNQKYRETEICVYEFNKHNINFPNIENSHVSEATYYRIFAEKFLPKEVTFYTYLDADIICINNPILYLNAIINEMKAKKYNIACNTEFNRTQNSEAMFDRLKMTSTRYFNAGVMIVNNESWIANNTTEKLIEKLRELKNNIKYWDQDVLNSFFNGDYLEISNNLNYQINLLNSFDLHEIEEKGIFLHYQSSNKPWTIQGCFNNASSFYQASALKNSGNYHLVKTLRRFDLTHLIKNTMNLKFKFLINKSKFYKESINVILGL